jgi:LEA14-like dessication related protein|tara:strand:+ start:133 stop:690 length:558 start_codon:yes stop_codon:yes gene_type:complete
MKLGFKTFFGLTVLVGGIAFVKYVVSQVKMLKGICVSSSSLNWQLPLFNALESKALGESIDVEIPLDITILNKSDLEVEVKDVKFDLLFQGIKIADVYNVGEFILKPKSNLTMNLQVDLIQFTNSELSDVGVEIAKIVFGTTDEATYEVSGDIKVQASIYEKLTIPYSMIVKGSEILEDGTTECK